MLRPVDRFLVLQRQIHYGNDVVAKVWVIWHSQPITEWPAMLKSASLLYGVIINEPKTNLSRV